jgi:hypothetical protein
MDVKSFITLGPEHRWFEIVCGTEVKVKKTFFFSISEWAK